MHGNRVEPPSAFAERVGGMLAAAVAVVFFWIVVLVAGRAGAQTPLLSPTIESTGGPTAAAFLDYDADGRDDMLVTAPAVESVLLHRQFGPASYFLTLAVPTPGRRPVDLAVADFDRNGRDDAAWVDASAGVVGVLYVEPALGSQVFRTAEFEGVDEATGIVALDRDADGWVDLAVTHTGADRLTWYRNELGTFVPEPGIEFGDGPSELVVHRGRGRLSALAVLQRGYLSRDVAIFDPARGVVLQRWALTSPAGLAAGDLDADGHDDLLLADGIGEIRVLRGSRTALFEDGGRFDVDPSVAGMVTLTPAASISAERLLVSEPGRGSMTLVEDAGSGFERADRAWYLGTDVGRLTRHDVDRDGVRELVVPLPRQDVVKLVEPRGEGWLLPRVWAVGRAPKRLRLDRADPDRPRVFTLCPGSLEIWVHRLSADAADVETIVPLSGDPDEFALADMDDDGDLDLLVLDRRGRVDLALGRADGGFDPFVELFEQNFAPDFVVADVWGDDRLEIVVVDIDVAGVRTFAETAPGTWTSVDVDDLDESPVVLGVRDLDLDGKDEVIALGRTAAVFFLFGSDEGLDTRFGFPVGLEPRSVDFGDFDQDQWPDVVVASAARSTFSVFWSVSRGNYEAGASSVAAPHGAQEIAVADVNGDGFDDVVAGGPERAQLSVHPGAGPAGAVLSISNSFWANEQSNAIALVDLDGDGRDDVVTVDRDGDQLVLMRTAPYVDVAAVTGTITSTRWLDGARIEVTSSARVVEQIGVRRAIDLEPVPLTPTPEGTWVGIDPLTPVPEAEYVLLDAAGNELDRAMTESPGDATSVGSPPMSSTIEPPLLENGIVRLRFRWAGNRHPRLDVYDVRGRWLARLDAEAVGDRWFETRWAGRDARGRSVARGRYLVRIADPDRTMSTPVTLR